jgi:endoglucanase
MFFTTRGKELIDQSNQPFIPKGMNWSEAWLIKSGDAAQNTAMGVNTVRIWCKQKDWREEIYTHGNPDFRLKQLVQWAHEVGLNVILVLGEMDKGHTNTIQPWRHHGIEKEMVAFWRSVAREFVAASNILGFEILNEPSEIHDRERYRSFCQRITQEIHNVDPKRLVCIPALDTGSPSGLVDDIIINDPRVFYSFNFYDPYQVTHTRPPTPWPYGHFNLERMSRQIGYVTAFRERNQVPVLCSELGCLWHAPQDSEIKWLSSLTTILNKNKVGWLFWGWKTFRSVSFHIYYNEKDRAIPMRMREWTEVKNLIEAKLRES